MLVLSRKKHQQIIIDEDIAVTVVDVRRDRVKLAIAAPKDVPVHRTEVHSAIKRKEAHDERNEESESACSPQR